MWFVSFHFCRVILSTRRFPPSCSIDKLLFPYFSIFSFLLVNMAGVYFEWKAMIELAVYERLRHPSHCEQ